MPSERRSLGGKPTYHSQSDRGNIDHLKITGGDGDFSQGIGGGAIGKHYAVLAAVRWSSRYRQRSRFGLSLASGKRGGFDKQEAAEQSRSREAKHQLRPRGI
jgi:hypothetical protein